MDTYISSYQVLLEVETHSQIYTHIKYKTFLSNVKNAVDLSDTCAEFQLTSYKGMHSDDNMPERQTR